MVVKGGNVTILSSFIDKSFIILRTPATCSTVESMTLSFRHYVPLHGNCVHSFLVPFTDRGS